jgi:hypothetical protein
MVSVVTVEDDIGFWDVVVGNGAAQQAQELCLSVVISPVLPVAGGEPSARRRGVGVRVGVGVGPYLSAAYAFGTPTLSRDGLTYAKLTAAAVPMPRCLSRACRVKR